MWGKLFIVVLGVAWMLNPHFGQHKFAAPAAGAAKFLGHMI